MKASVKIESDPSFARTGRREALAVVVAMVVAFAAVSCAPSTPPSTTGMGGTGATETAEVAGARAAAATPAPAPSATAAPTVVPTTTATPDIQKVKPNELGTIPILEYHIIADAEEDQWTRTPEHFRQDLQKLYDAGYRPIALNDLLDNYIRVPAGFSPVVITFDDSSPGQFRFIQRNGQTVVDPESAVGMLEAFHASHPDFPLRATFSVLPEAEQPHKLFGQPEYESQKLRYLVDRGMEIANHTYWHQRLDEVDDQDVVYQIAMAVKVIQQAVPGYRMRTLTLPMGLWPSNRSLAISGTFEGIPYRHDGILLVASDPAPSPNSRDFDPHALQRVQVFADNLDRWIAYLAKNQDERYVSDGDPNTVSFPRHLESQLSRGSVGNKTVRAY